MSVWGPYRPGPQLRCQAGAAGEQQQLNWQACALAGSMEWSQSCLILLSTYAQSSTGSCPAGAQGSERQMLCTQSCTESHSKTLACCSHEHHSRGRWRSQLVSLECQLVCQSCQNKLLAAVGFFLCVYAQLSRSQCCCCQSRGCATLAITDTRWVCTCAATTGMSCLGGLQRRRRHLFAAEVFKSAAAAAASIAETSLRSTGDDQGHGAMLRLPLICQLALCVLLVFGQVCRAPGRRDKAFIGVHHSSKPGLSLLEQL